MRTASTNDKRPRYYIARLIFGFLVVFSVTLFAIHGLAQSPPTASEAFDLRINAKKCRMKRRRYLSKQTV